MTGRPAPHQSSKRVRMLRKRIQIAYKVLRYGEFALRGGGHVYTGTSGSFITPWQTCQRCGMPVDVTKPPTPCPSLPQKVVIRP